MSQNLHQIIYISTAEPCLTESELLDLLEKSRIHNAEREITGLLLHSDGNLIQVIEGPRQEIEALYEKIAQDHRHRGVTLMSNRPIERRDFPHFKMGFKRVQSKHIEINIPNFSKVVDNGGFSQEELKGLSKLVRTFLQTFARTTNIDRYSQSLKS
jgi:hypothetical protein